MRRQRRRLRGSLKIFNVSAFHFIFTCVALDACLAYGCFFAKYRHQAHAQFKVFGDQVKAWDEKLEALTAGIKPVLDYIGFAPPKGATGSAPA